MTVSGSALGLVYNSTSGKSRAEFLKPLSHIVDAHLNRVRRVGHSVKTTARLHQEEIGRSGFRFKPAMITCTYAADSHWGKRHISDLLTHCRKYLARRYNQTKFRYTWVAELQKRGVIHYHVILWLPKGCTLPKPDKRGWWPYGQTRIEWVKNAVGYLAKYASKGSDTTNHKFPKGARINGYGGLDLDSRKEYRFWRAPLSIRSKINPDVEKAPSLFDMRKISGGYVDRHTGEFIESDYTMVLINGSQHIVKKEYLYV